MLQEGIDEWADGAHEKVKTDYICQPMDNLVQPELLRLSYSSLLSVPLRETSVNENDSPQPRNGLAAAALLSGRGMVPEAVSLAPLSVAQPCHACLSWASHPGGPPPLWVLVERGSIGSTTS